jgi:hypothetical protein
MKKIIIAIMILSTSIYAGTVATITALKGQADIKRDKGLFTAHLGDKLHEKDLVITKDKSKVQIIFKDDTLITVGKNSNFSIEKYIYEENNPKVSARFGLIRGTMRTITGKIGKIAPARFSVKTKTTTIGIRGTNFTIRNAGADGVQKVYCTLGAVDVKVVSTGESINVKQGSYVSVAIDGSTQLQKYTAKNLSNMQKEEFPNGVTKSNKKSVAKKSASRVKEIISKNSKSVINTNPKVAEDISSLSGDILPVPGADGIRGNTVTDNNKPVIDTDNNKPVIDTDNGEDLVISIIGDDGTAGGTGGTTDKTPITTPIVKYSGTWDGGQRYVGKRTDTVKGSADISVNFNSSKVNLTIHDAVKGDSKTTFNGMVLNNDKVRFSGPQTSGNERYPDTGSAEGKIIDSGDFIQGSAEIYREGKLKAKVPSYKIPKTSTTN